MEGGREGSGGGATLPLWGNRHTYNLESVMATNVRGSEYFLKRDVVLALYERDVH